MEDGDSADELPPLPLNTDLSPVSWTHIVYKMARETLFFSLTFFFCIYTPYVQTNPPSLQTRSAPASVAFLTNPIWVDDYYLGDVFAAFEEAQNHANAMILFYAPWDVDSRKAVEVLEEVGRILADHQDLYLAAVNCWTHEGECYKEFGAGKKPKGAKSGTRMDQFPILVFYPFGRRGIQYNGPLTVQHITQFLLHAQNPLTRVDSVADLHHLQAKNGGQAVVGHFVNLTMAHVGRNYRRFLQAAYDLLEFDPFRTRYGGLGVVISREAAYQLHLNPPHQPVKLFHWNGTASTYPNKTISHVNVLLKWIGEKANPLTSWTGTSGQKSLHFSSSLSLGSGHSLLAFIPRTMMNHFDPSLAVFQEAALRYYSCTQETRQATRGLLRHIKYLKRTSNLELERTLQDCAQDPWFFKEMCNGLFSHSPNACICSSSTLLNRTFPNNEAFSGRSAFMLKSRRPNQKPSGPIVDEFVANHIVNQKRLNCALNANIPNLCHILSGVANPANLDAEFLDIGSDLDGLGCEDNKTLNFYTLDETTQSFLAQSLGVDLSENTEPALILVSPELESSFKMESNFNLETISQFVLQFHRQGDSLQRIQRSEIPNESLDIAENGEIQVIPRVNTNNFDKLVLNSSQNVVLGLSIITISSMFRKKQRNRCLNLILRGHLPILTWIGFGCAVFLIRLNTSNINNSQSNSVESEWRISPIPVETPHVVMMSLNQTSNTSDVLTIDELIQSIDCHEESSYSSEEVKQLTAQFLSPTQILARTSDCDNYFTIIKTFGLAPFLDSETEYPLAFSHGVHTQPGLLELFLSLTFRPMDSHCIHVDAKAPDEVQAAIMGIVKCYNYKFKKANVFVAKHSIPVFWGHHSVLDIDLMCMRQLREAPRSQQKWRALLNPAGSELPLKSINSIRQILFSKRENIIPIHHSINAYRQATRFKLTRYGPGQYHLWNERVESCPKGPTPYNITILKGSKNVILTREFVDFILEDPIAIELYNWLKDTRVPDEHFYSTLATLEIEYIAATSARSVSQNMGMIQSNEEAHQPKGVCFRESLWGYSNCKGRNIHSICNFGMGDLEELKKSICFTGNKFNLDVDTMAPICMYKDVRHKTKLDRWREWKENELDKHHGVPEQPDEEPNE